MAAKRKRVGDAFGLALKDARTKAGLTQEDLAHEAKYATVFISLLENGHREPTISAVLSLERALGIEAGALVSATAKVLDRRKG